MANVCVKMKLNCGSFLLIFLFTLNGLVDKVSSEGTEFETETESIGTGLATLVDSNEFNSQEDNRDEIDSDDIMDDEISSDEHIECTDFDLPSADTEGGVDTTGMQISADQIAPIINQLLGPLSQTIQPYLGPLAPLSNVLGSVISQTVTEVVVNLLNETVNSTKRQEFLQIRNYTSYTSYLVTIPNNGRFLLFTKTPTAHAKPKLRRKNTRGCT